MREKKVILHVEYSDGKKDYLKTAIWKDGIVLSGFDNSEILTKKGCWEIRRGITQGWIYFDDEGVILEKNTDGHVCLEIEEV